MADSPYPGASPDRQLLLRVAGTLESVHRCVHRLEERQNAAMAVADSVPPMRPRLDTHRGLGVPEEQGALEEVVETIQDRRELAAMKDHRKFIVGVIKGTLIAVSGAAAWKLAEYAFAVLGHK
ncbi:MAG TPA: hypothetical protein VN894_17755 [Polyangiaceae bacterium]|nr:hypothetical protein [Polyangiaceae bacterium]